MEKICGNCRWSYTLVHPNESLVDLLCLYNFRGAKRDWPYTKEDMFCPEFEKKKESE